MARRWRSRHRRLLVGGVVRWVAGHGHMGIPRCGHIRNVMVSGCVVRHTGEEMTYPLMPLGPQQQHVVRLITIYLKDHDQIDPHEAALEIWRITQTKLRPVKRRTL